MTTPRPFLTAQWRHLLMLNYDVDPELLGPHVPAGTELDLWQDEAVISLVGFRFLHTRLKGWPVPLHQNFPEVNLRFYVRRETNEGRRRGVVFLKEVVPKFAVSWVANTIYGENYLTLPMSHRVHVPASLADRTGLAEYRWRLGRQEYQLKAEFSGLPQPFAEGSEPEFITEHYWGYTRRRDGSTSEYFVDHPAWRVWKTDSASFAGDATPLYGPEFANILHRPPRSALVADGSTVSVYPGQRVALTPAAVSLSSPAPAR